MESSGREHLLGMHYPHTDKSLGFLLLLLGALLRYKAGWRLDWETIIGPAGFRAPWKEIAGHVLKWFGGSLGSLLWYAGVLMIFLFDFL